MQSAGCGIGYEVTQSRSGASNFPSFSSWYQNHEGFCGVTMIIFVHAFGFFWARVRYLFCCLKVWFLRGCWLSLFAIFRSNDSPFYFCNLCSSGAFSFPLFHALPPYSKASDLSNLSYVWERDDCILPSRYTYFPLCGFPSHHPTRGKRFPNLKFQTALPLCHSNLLPVPPPLLVTPALF